MIKYPRLVIVISVLLGISLIGIAFGSYWTAYNYRRHDYIKTNGIVDWLEPCFDVSSREGVLAHIDISIDEFSGCAMYFHSCCVSSVSNNCLKIGDPVNMWYDRKTCHYSFDGRKYYRYSRVSSFVTYPYRLFQKLWLPPLLESILGVISLSVAFLSWKLLFKKNSLKSNERYTLKSNMFPIETDDALRGILA